MVEGVEGVEVVNDVDGVDLEEVVRVDGEGEIGGEEGDFGVGVLWVFRVGGVDLFVRWRDEEVEGEGLGGMVGVVRGWKRNG